MKNLNLVSLSIFTMIHIQARNFASNECLWPVKARLSLFQVPSIHVAKINFTLFNVVWRNEAEKRSQLMLYAWIISAENFQAFSRMRRFSSWFINWLLKNFISTFKLKSRSQWVYFSGQDLKFNKPLFLNKDFDDACVFQAAFFQLFEIFQQIQSNVACCHEITNNKKKREIWNYKEKIECPWEMNGFFYTLFFCGWKSEFLSIIMNIPEVKSRP